MKIIDIHSSSQPVSKVRGEGIDKGNPPIVPFKDVLTKVDDDDLNRQLYRLLGDIDKIGQRLDKKSDIEDLLEYKRLVGQFLSRVLDNAFKRSTTAHFDKRGRQRIFSMVKRVNSRLEDLTREMFDKEQGTLNLLERIGEIRGLLIDLLV